MIHLIRKIAGEIFNVSTFCGGYNVKFVKRLSIFCIWRISQCKYLSFRESFLLFNCAREHGVCVCEWVQEDWRRNKNEKVRENSINNNKLKDKYLRVKRRENNFQIFTFSFLAWSYRTGKLNDALRRYWILLIVWTSNLQPFIADNKFLFY